MICLLLLRTCAIIVYKVLGYTFGNLNADLFLNHFLIQNYIKLSYYINITMDNELLHKIKQLEDELNETKQHLKKYTAPKRSKVYYENHKDEINSRSKQDPNYKEKRKEYNKTSYLRRKEKAKMEEPKNENI
jgi:hypothetical protein